MWPSTTKALAPLSLKPLPERTACNLVCSGRCFAPSSIASAASSEPSEIFGRCAAFCASLPPRVSADAASTAVDRNGDGISVRPISSITTPASTQPSPLPPKFSGTSRPEKPISANAFQSSRENPVASLLSRKLRRCDTGALSLIRPRALSRSMDCSSVRTSAMERIPVVELTETDLCSSCPVMCRDARLGARLATILSIVDDAGSRSRPDDECGRFYAPGRSRMRLATMPSITSEVPPSIELALVRSQARGRAPPLERSLSHSSASTPPADIRIS